MVTCQHGSRLQRLLFSWKAVVMLILNGYYKHNNTQNCDRVLFLLTGIWIYNFKSFPMTPLRRLSNKIWLKSFQCFRVSVLEKHFFWINELKNISRFSCFLIKWYENSCLYVGYFLILFFSLSMKPSFHWLNNEWPDGHSYIIGHNFVGFI